MGFELKDLEKDALRELGNIGAGNAATALSQMLGSTVTITVPKIFLTPIEKVPELLGEPETVMASVYMKVFGDVPSRILVFFPEPSIFPLLQLLLAAIQAKPEGMAEQEQSALKELGNILGCAYLNAMSKFLGLTFIPSVPALAVDMVGSIMQEVVMDAGESAPQAIFIETEFIGGNQPVKGQFFLIPDGKALPVLLQAILRACGLPYQP